MTEQQTEPKAEKQDKALSWCLVAVCVFVLRVYAWMSSELWYDEVLTLQRFVLPHGNDMWGVFRDYPIANNHMLSTALTVWWLQLLGGGFSEFLFRVPSLVFGMVSIAVVMLHWRKRLGEPLAALGGFLLAVSPVFTAYAYQLRGYSLTMLLGVLAVSGALEVTRGRGFGGQALLCAAGALLPLVMPSNLVLAPVMAVFVVALARESGAAWKTSLLRALPWCAATLAGASWYLVILEQTRKALAEPDGWSSGLAVAGNLLLALAVHGAVPLVLLAAALLRRGTAESPRGARLRALRPQAAVMAAAVLTMAAAIVASGAGRAPFPRVFLVLLPFATFVLLDALRLASPEAARTPSAEERKHGLTWAAKAALAALVAGIVCERVAEGVTDYQLKHGAIPDNLLQQYYRGAADLREIAERQDLELGSALVLTDAYDAMSASFYCGLYRKPEAQGVVVGSNLLNDQARQQLPHSPLRKVAIAGNAEAAQALFRQAGLEAKTVRELCRTSSGRRGVYALP